MNKEVQIIISGKDLASATFRNVGAAAGEAKNEFANAGTILRNLISVGLKTAVIGTSLKTLKDFAFDFNAEMEQSQIGFETMIGNTRDANRFLRDMMITAADTNLTFPQIKEAAGLMKAFGWETKQIIPDIIAVGNAVAGLGGGADKVNRIVLALGQMQAKGKVSAEELLQLTEAGIPAYEILQQKLGLTADQVANIGKQGIRADAAIRALIDGMNERFPDMMKKQSDSAIAMLSTISDNTQLMLGTVTKGLFDITKDALRGVRDFTNQVRVAIVDGSMGIITQAERMAETYGNQVAELDKLIPRYEELNGKANISQKEHEELRSVIDRIVQLAPQAVVGYDDMGRALIGNAEGARQAREELWQLRNEQLKIAAARVKFELPKLEEKVKELEPQFKKAQEELNKIAPRYFQIRDVAFRISMAETQEEINRIRAEAIELGIITGAPLATQLHAAEETYNRIYERYKTLGDSLSETKADILELKNAEADLAEWQKLKPGEKPKSKESKSDKPKVIIDPTKELNDALKARQEYTDKANRLTMSRFEYERWALQQEKKEVEKLYKGKKDVLDEFERYYKAKSESIDKAEKEYLEKNKSEWEDWGTQVEKITEQAASSAQQSFSDFFFDAMTGKLEDLGDYFQSFLNALVRSFANAMSGMMTNELMTSLGFKIPQRKKGGPVLSNRPYIVGEEGWEVFVPDTNGYIVPNDKLGGVNVQVNVINKGTPVAVEGQQVRTSPTGPIIDIFLTEVTKALTSNKGGFRDAVRAAARS